MSQRPSGRERIAADLYPTPSWVVDALAEHVDFNGVAVWEPACGPGKMVRALEAHGAHVFATDAFDQGFEGMAQLFDFTERQTPSQAYYDMIVTNCPYGVQGRLAEKFIERGLERLPPGGVLALLLQADFDSAGGRKRMFRDHPMFAGRIVLNRRIVWFDPPPPKPGEKKPGGPSANHAWFLWSRPRIRSTAPAFTLYAPCDERRAA